jgi:hypothetical protein
VEPSLTDSEAGIIVGRLLGPAVDASKA